MTIKFLRKGIHLFAITAIAITGFAAEKPLNVVFISIDDMNTDIGPYGNAQVKTPNFDRLAEQGVVFRNAYCQQPLCGPSRASVMTGLRPNTNGMLGNNEHFRDTVPDVVTMGQFFQKNGYYVGRVGKVYHYSNPSSIGTDGNDDAPTWQERFNPVGIDKTQDKKVTRYGKMKGGLGISLAWWDPVSEDEEHTDGKVASHAIEMIDRNQDKPFFVAAGFFNPHCPYIAPKKYFDLYPLETITMPDLDEAKRDLEDVPSMAISRDSGKRWPYYFPGVSLEEARLCKRAYYACISFVDAQVGRILDALEERDLMDSTMIVLWSDHGYFLGEKGLWYKRKNFERSLLSPLIISAPGIQGSGKQCFSNVELLDLYPTIAEVTGHSVPNHLEGKSLKPLLNAPDSEWNRPAISQVLYRSGYGYSIRLGRWRYTEWNDGNNGIELYNHSNDPEEITNLAPRREYADLVKGLSAQLRPYAENQRPVGKRNRRKSP